MKCPNCGYERPMGILPSLEGDRGKNFCPECGKRLREIPHVPMPPDWDTFEITIKGMAARMSMQGTAKSGNWILTAEGPSEELEQKLRYRWQRSCATAQMRNEEIDRINKGE